jgi:hypothetical protein
MLTILAATFLVWALPTEHPWLLGIGIFCALEALAWKNSDDK